MLQDPVAAAEVTETLTVPASLVPLYETGTSIKVAPCCTKMLYGLGFVLKPAPLIFTAAIPFIAEEIGIRKTSA